MILTTLFFVIIASFLSIYPIQERVSLYLLPFIILFIVLPFDYFKQIWIKILCVILLCFTFVGNFNYSIISSNIENHDIMMQILKSKYQEGDYIIYNNVSDSQFEIYAYLYNFKSYGNKIGKFKLTDYGENWYYSVLNTLPKGKRYWFFYAYDLDTKPVIPFLKNWAKRNGKILYEETFNKKSYLLYIQL